MQLSTELLISMALLASTGVGQNALGNPGIGKAMFLLFCVYVMDLISDMPLEELYLSPACLFIAAAFYGCAAVNQKGRPVLAGIIAVAMGLATSAVWRKSEAVVLIVGAMAVFPALVLEVYSAAAAACLTPLAAETASFVMTSLTTGYAVLNIGGEVLAAQLVGIVCTVIIKSAVLKEKDKTRTTDRQISDARTRPASRLGDTG